MRPATGLACDKQASKRLLAQGTPEPVLCPVRGCLKDSNSQGPSVVVVPPPPVLPMGRQEGPRREAERGGARVSVPGRSRELVLLPRDPAQGPVRAAAQCQGQGAVWEQPWRLCPAARPSSTRKAGSPGRQQRGKEMSSWRLGRAQSWSQAGTRDAAQTTLRSRGGSVCLFPWETPAWWKMRAEAQRILLLAHSQVASLRVHVLLGGRGAKCLRKGATNGGRKHWKQQRPLSAVSLQKEADLLFLLPGFALITNQPFYRASPANRGLPSLGGSTPPPPVNWPNGHHFSPLKGPRRLPVLWDLVSPAPSLRVPSQLPWG